MIRKFKELSGEHKFNALGVTILLCIVWVALCSVFDSLVLGVKKPEPEVKVLKVVKHSYEVDGKTYTLNQKVTLVDDKLVVEDVEEGK